MRRKALRRVAAAIQARNVLPHCPSCRAPCCRLETLVLELDWGRMRALWGLDVSRSAFDRMLDCGDGPPEIRIQDGLYYAHGTPCPAYRARKCLVYGSPLKPPGCSDFPVYEEGGRLVADLRCEALDIGAVEAELRAALPPGEGIIRTSQGSFRFLVTFDVRRRCSAKEFRQPQSPAPRVGSGDSRTRGTKHETLRRY